MYKLKTERLSSFTDKFVISGAVENWLNAFTDHLKELALILDRSLTAAVHWEDPSEKSRHEWVLIILHSTQWLGL